MSNKLNEQYFETKKKFQNTKKKEFTFKRGLINLIVFFILIFVYNILHKDCSNRINNNKKNDILIKSKISN